MKNKVIAAMLAVCIMAGSLGNYAETQAACSGYTEYKKDKEFCDDSQGCGFFWLQDTMKYLSHQEHYCDKDGKQVRKIRKTYIKTGCC